MGSRTGWIALALAGAVLACATPASADELITPRHHYSVSADSARIGGGTVVLDGVATHGLLEHLGRENADRMAVEELVQQWSRLGGKPYASVTYSGRGSADVRPTGAPTYDPKRHRLTIPVDDRRSPRKLRNTRWVFSHRRAAATGLHSQSRSFGPFNFVVTTPGDSSRASIVIQHGAAAYHVPDLTVSRRVQEISWTVGGGDGFDGKLTFTPRAGSRGGVVYLSAKFYIHDSVGLYGGALVGLR